RRETLRQTMIQFAPAEGPISPAPGPPFAGARELASRAAEAGARGPGPRESVRIPPFNEEQKLWQLRLTHRAGSLEAAVAFVRHRNLLTNFGILALLAVSIALLLQSARSAQRLARREMDFVAGVSHELRTPLAVIKSAAWSLTRGVVKD